MATEITFNPLFDYKSIARDALQKIGLDEKYLQDEQELLPEGFTSEPINNESSDLPEGFTVEAINYTVPPGSEAIPTYVNGIAESLVQRQEEYQQIVSDYASGKINVLQANVDVFGKTIVGSAFDVLGETAIFALKGISLLIPDAIEDPVKDTVKKSFDFLINTEEGKYALEQLDKGVVAWGKYKEENPENARTIEAVVNTALLFTPVKTKAKANPTTHTYTGGAVIGKVEEAAGKQLTRTTKQRVEKLLEPERTPDRVADVINTNVRGKRIDKTGILGVTKIKLNEFEIFRNNLVSNIAGFKAKDTIVNSANVVRKHNKTKAQQLMNELDKLNIRWNFPEGTKKEIADRVAVLLKDKNYLQADEGVRKLVEANLASAMRIIDDMPNTPAGLLRARQAFDKMLNDQAKGAAFDPKVINATTDSANAVRTAINDLIQSRVASSNVSVKQSLREQHALWNAQNILDLKAAKEGANRFSRILDNVKGLVDTQLLVNRIVAVGGGVGAFQAAQIIAMPLTGSVVLGGLGYALTKGVLSISGKRALASTLSAIDRAIKVSTNPKMIRQLRLDRAYVVDLMKQPLTKEDESFAVN